MIEKLINRPERIAVFGGSFNPFTIGHASIVERGLKLFDRIVVAVGVNACKPGLHAEQCADEIKKLYRDNERVKVVTWSGLMVDLAKQENAGFFLRGVRNTVDYEYERNMAEINSRISGIETILMFALPEYGAVSSSVVRELESYGVNVDAFLPKKEN